MSITLSSARMATVIVSFSISWSMMPSSLMWVSRITAIGLSMFLPGLAGNWLDARLGLTFLGPLGFVLGFVAGLSQLVAISRRSRP